MPSSDSLRKLLTDRSSIKGKVEWFGDWVPCTVDRFSDTEIRLNSNVKQGDLVILKGLNFPFDGVHTIGEGNTISFEESHGIEEETECWVGTWQNWNVYEPESLALAKFTRLQQIQYVDRQVLSNRPTSRAQEQAIVAAQAQGLITIAADLEGFDTTVAMAQLNTFLAGDRSHESVAFTIGALLETDSLCLASIADRLRAGDFEVNPKTLQIELVKEMMPKLEVIGKLDLSIMGKLQEMERDNSLAEIQDDHDFIALIGEETELLCKMPPDLLASHAEMSRTLQQAVIELYKEIGEIRNKASEEKGTSGKPIKVTAKRTTKSSVTAS